MQETGLFYTVIAKSIEKLFIYLFVDYMINVPIMKEIGLVLILSAPRAREDNCCVHIINVPMAEKTNIQLYTLSAKSILKTKLFLI